MLYGAQPTFERVLWSSHSDAMIQPGGLASNCFKSNFTSRLCLVNNWLCHDYQYIAKVF